MQQYQQSILVKTAPKCLHKVTSQVNQVVAAAGIKVGMCHLFLRHTSASLIIQENADPDVLVDLANFFSQLVPESARYVHSTEGPDDMPAHIRTVLTNTSEQIPIANGRLVLGTWQGIYVWEHRQMAHQRELFVHLTGE
jgi:secondary thiamine-phosphate synthase enzyme